MPNNAKGADGRVHHVIIDDDNEREYGQIACGTWFYWQMAPVETLIRHYSDSVVAHPMNPTRRLVTCLECIAAS